MAAGKKGKWRRTGATSAVLEVDLGRPHSFSIARLEEPIEKGQMVSSHTLHGAGGDQVFRPLAKGTTIGYARLQKLTAENVRFVKVEIDGVAPPEPVRLKLFA